MVQNNFLWHKRRRVDIKIENNLNVETQKSQSYRAVNCKLSVATPCDHVNIQISHQNALGRESLVLILDIWTHRLRVF